MLKAVVARTRLFVPIGDAVREAKERGPAQKRF